MKAYWWDEKRNMGDQLTPILLRHFAGFEVEWAAPRKAEWIACGSIVSHIPPGWTGTVWGSGKMRQKDTADLSQARVLALRGKLTATDLGVDCALGDPGLLVSLLPGMQRTNEFELGIIPHWQDRGLIWNFRGTKINVLEEPLSVIRQIARCKRIISSSLHGIIVADAFGITRRWQRSRQATPYKFADYMSVIGDFEPSVWGRADRRKVKATQERLLACLAS